MNSTGFTPGLGISMGSVAAGFGIGAGAGANGNMGGVIMTNGISGVASNGAAASSVAYQNIGPQYGDNDIVVGEGIGQQLPRSGLSAVLETDISKLDSAVLLNSVNLAIENVR